MHRFAITCNQSAPASFERCETLQPPDDLSFEDYASWAEATLKELNWSAQGNAHYCPKHNPANKGKTFEVGKNYLEIVPGVRVRWPGTDREDFTIPIEVQVQDRECHGYDGAVCGGGSGVYGIGTEYAAWHQPETKAGG